MHNYKKKIFIVIPVHNRKTFTRDCLRSLRTQTFRNFITIVIDDGSLDGTSEMIKEEFPEIDLFHGDGNLWWTGAVNVGIRHVLAEASDNDYILLLNDDLVLDENYLEKLSEAADKFPNSIIGSVEVINTKPYTIRNGGFIINKLSAKNIILNKGMNLLSFNKDYYNKVTTLNGRGTLYPIYVFKNVGLFDDSHFKQCGDTELPMRAHLKGIKLYVYYGAVVKSYAKQENTENINLKVKYAISDIKKYYFDIRSNCRLIYRWHLSQRISKNPLVCFNYFILDFLRITKHFIFNIQLFKK